MAPITTHPIKWTGGQRWLLMITHNLLGKCERRKCHTRTLKLPCDGHLTAQAWNAPGLISATSPHLSSPFHEDRGARWDAPYSLQPCRRH